MNLDNEKLRAIQKEKAELKKEMKSCYDIGQLIQMDMAYNILDDEETEILNRMGVKT